MPIYTIFGILVIVNLLIELLLQKQQERERERERERGGGERERERFDFTLHLNTFENKSLQFLSLLQHQHLWFLPPLSV